MPKVISPSVGLILDAIGIKVTDFMPGEEPLLTIEEACRNSDDILIPNALQTADILGIEMSPDVRVEVQEYIDREKTIFDMQANAGTQEGVWAFYEEPGVAQIMGVPVHVDPGVPEDMAVLTGRDLSGVCRQMIRRDSGFESAGEVMARMTEEQSFMGWAMMQHTHECPGYVPKSSAKEIQDWEIRWRK